MTEPDSGDPNTLRIGGWVPNSETTQPDPADAVTQQLPAIRDDPHGRELVLVGGVWQDEERPGADSPARRIRTAIVAVVLGIAAVVAVPLTIRSAPPPREYADSWEFDPVPAPEIVLTEALSATSAPPATRRTTPAPTLAPTPSPTPIGLFGPTATPRPTPTPSPTPFAPLTLEAENAVRQGSAESDTPSCARSVRVVRQIGDWTSFPEADNDGTLTFTNLSVPPGAYTLTVHYVITSDSSRTAQIRFIGPNQSTITATFPASTCMTSRQVPVTIPAGTTGIEFSNSTGRAPSIDKIVLTR